MSEVVAEFHAGRWTDGRTDMTKLIVAYRNFANGPNNGLNSRRKHPNSRDSDLAQG